MPEPPIERAFPGAYPRTTSELRASFLQLPLDDDETLFLFVQSIHPTLTATVTFAWRFWSDRERQIKNSSRELVVTPGGAGVARANLERGSLLTMRIQETSNPELPLGNLWARAILIKGTTGAILGTGLIAQGYVSQTNEIAWPGSPIQTLLDGPGVVRAVAWTVVGLGSLQATVPAGRRWRVISSMSQIAPVPAGVARIFSVNAQTGAGLYFYGESSFAAAAGSTANVSIAPSMVQTVAPLSAQYLLPFPPDLELRGGDSLFKTIVNPVAGDAWTATGFVFVREWFDPT